jgi:hypothetical protein
VPNPTSDVKNRIYDRIVGRAPTGVWSRNDFLDLGTQFSVEKALQRLQKDGLIRRPHRGLYDKPGRSGLTGGLLFPPRSSFVDAIARRDKLKILVDGMTAANGLGLTTAVPSRSVIHANTYPRTIEIHANVGDAPTKPPVIYRLEFKRISASSEFWAGRAGMHVIRALDWYRDQSAQKTDELVNGIVRALESDPEGARAARDVGENIAAAPAWMHPIIRRIAAHFAKEKTAQFLKETQPHAPGRDA